MNYYIIENNNEMINSIFKRFKPISKKKIEHDFFNSFIKSKKDLKKYLNKDLIESNILIIGCGYRYPDVLLYEEFVKSVKGCDITSFYKDGFFKNLQYELSNNNCSFLRALARTYILRYGLKNSYYQELKSLSQSDLNHDVADLKTYDGKTLPYDDGQFDAVLSTAVLEHVMDLEQFFKELYRVTSKNGINHHLYHNFYSYSGAHLPERVNQKYPWGHLTGHNEFSRSSLNTVTLEEVKKIFRNHFNIFDIFGTDKDHNKKNVDENFEYEKKHLLKSEIRNKLVHIDTEDLLTRGYLIIGKKK